MSRRFWLRERTAKAHAALENLIGNLDSRAAYERYAAGLYRGRVPLERWLSGLTWPGIFGDWRSARIGRLLARDLDDLGVSVEVPPVAPQLSGTVEDILGILYVLEGSGLGARVVLHRARSLGLSEGFGARHLAHQAAAGGWAPFVSLLDAAPDIDMERTGRAADWTFETIHEAMAAEHAAV